MGVDPQAERFLKMLDASGSPARDRSVEGYRRGYERICALAAPENPTACRVTDSSLPNGAGDLPMRIYEPSEGTSAATTLIWLHGGGWIAGGLATADPLCRALCRAGKMRVVALSYRLAPESPFPAGLTDCQQAFFAFVARAGDFGCRADRIALGGESAGAHLALSVASAAVERGAPLARLLLLCPVVDPLGDWPSRRAFAHGRLIEAEALQDFLSFYAAPEHLDDPRISPLRGIDFGGFPPTDVHVAECDPMRDEGEALADALRKAGAPVSCTRHEGMIHQFYSLTGAISRARSALDELAAQFSAAAEASYSRMSPDRMRA